MTTKFETLKDKFPEVQGEQLGSFYKSLYQEIPFIELDKFPKIVTGVVVEEFLDSNITSPLLTAMQNNYKENHHYLLAMYEGEIVVTHARRTNFTPVEETLETYISNQLNLVDKEFFNDLGEINGYPNLQVASSGLFEYFTQSFKDFDKLPKYFHWVIKTDLFGISQEYELTFEDIQDYAKLIAFIFDLSSDCQKVSILKDDVTDYSINVGLEY